VGWIHWTQGQDWWRLLRTRCWTLTFHKMPRIS
jgi:hypothetical protein